MNVDEDIVVGLEVFIFFVLDFDGGLNGFVLYLILFRNLLEFSDGLWSLNFFIGKFILNGKKMIDFLKFVICNDILNFCFFSFFI